MTVPRFAVRVQTAFKRLARWNLGASETSLPPQSRLLGEKEKIKKNTQPTNNQIYSEEASNNTILNSGVDDTVFTYRDVACESIQRQYALLKKKTLRFSQGSGSSGFGNDTPLSDEDVDVTVIPFSQKVPITHCDSSSWKKKYCKKFIGRDPSQKGSV